MPAKSLTPAIAFIHNSPDAPSADAQRKVIADLAAKNGFWIIAEFTSDELPLLLQRRGDLYIIAGTNHWDDLADLMGRLLSPPDPDGLLDLNDPDAVAAEKQRIMLP